MLSSNDFALIERCATIMSQGSSDAVDLSSLEAFEVPEGPEAVVDTLARLVEEKT